jgi:hypothetical protein
MPISREDSVYLAKQAEHYEEIVENMKRVVSSDQELTVEDQIFFLLLTRTFKLLVPAVLRGELSRQLSRRKNQKGTRLKFL